VEVERPLERRQIMEMSVMFGRRELHCPETINLRRSFKNEERLNLNKEIAYMKILRCTNS
jgi:hypothetical protein